MTRLALMLCAIAAPAAADVRLVVMPAGSDHLAEIVLENGLGGLGEKTFTLSDPAVGDVLVSHTITQNGPDGCCDDSLSVLDLPRDVVADQIDVVVHEGDRAVIRLYRWSGM